MPVELIEQKRQEILQRIQNAREEYPSLWRELIQDWASDGGEDAVWLTYAACYLLRTGGVRWALDPYSLFTRVGGGSQMDFAKDLEPLQLIVLSHAHSDHLDLNLIACLRSLPLTWVIPDFMRERVSRAGVLPEDRIITPQPGLPIHFGELTLMPFEALHFRGADGVPEMGYLAEFSGKRWLFPGDTRTYDALRIPSFAGLNGVLAHLWLGKGCALEETPALLSEFCEFFAHFKSERIVVTHLEEFGRDANDFWECRHFRQVELRFATISPSVRVSSALMGQKVVI